ncbi:hypothetical protein EVAR_52_1 [Eumeta japonica]|uniref:Uncharacterized protein n=1 Tax=Eumeta variegata TaxID=151549 RepID=A0A4C1SBD8_EUMVA|nr:hypothetical protein EVAR_52_1 [Eumeta japonica]
MRRIETMLRKKLRAIVEVDIPMVEISILKGERAGGCFFENPLVYQEGLEQTLGGDIELPVYCINEENLAVENDFYRIHRDLLTSAHKCIGHFSFFSKSDSEPDRRKRAYIMTDSIA